MLAVQPETKWGKTFSLIWIGLLRNYSLLVHFCQTSLNLFRLFDSWKMAVNICFQGFKMSLPGFLNLTNSVFGIVGSGLTS